MEIEQEVKTKKATKNKVVPKFAKADVIKSNKFSNIERDFLKNILPEGEYTVDEVEKFLEKQSKGEVK